LGTAFLKQTKNRVQHQQSGDNRRLGVIAQDELKHDGSFQHPRYRGPEFLQRGGERMDAGVRHRIAAVLLQSALGLVTGKTCAGGSIGRGRCCAGHRPAQRIIDKLLMEYAS
jgi:hypothetical protein